MNRKIARYKKDLEYSYVLGATLVFEAIKYKKDYVEKIYLHPDASDTIVADLREKAKGIIFEVNQKVFNILSDKENCFVIAVIRKYNDVLRMTGSSHY